MPTDLSIVITFEFTISIIGFLIVSIPLLKKYKARKSNVTLLVFLATTADLLGGFLSAIGRVLRYTGLWQIQPGVKLELLTFTVAFIAISDAFFFAFTLEVFRGGLSQGKNKTLAGLFFLIVAIYVVYDFATGLFQVDLTLMIWLILIGLTFFAMIYLTAKAWGASRKFENRVDTLCSKLIAFGSFFLVIAFIFHAIESVLTYANGGVTQYSIYYFIGWTLILVAIFILSTGYLQPDWLKRRIEAK